MKYFAFFIALVFIAVAACTPERSGTDADVTDAHESPEVQETYLAFTTNSESTTLGWRGRKVGGGHHGTINVTEGTIYLNEDDVVAGIFEIDMKSIKNIDLEDPDRNAKLVGHLKSEDFFEVETYPTATFELTGVKELDNPEDYEEEGYTHRVSGNLTMKDITNGISFPARLEVYEDEIFMEANFNIDRAKWNVKYGSESFFDNLGDDMIMDEINLTLDLHAQFEEKVAPEEVISEEKVTEEAEARK